VPIKTVLITGANGFVANHIAQTLQQRGYTLILLDRAFDLERQRFWSPRGVGLIETELATFHQFLAVDAIIHAAALTAEPQELGVTPTAYLKANLDANFLMLEWARVNKVKRFIFISSAGVFASHQQENLTEIAPPFAKGLYALAKRTTEDLIETLNAKEKCEFVSVRLGNVYGADEIPRTSRPRVSLLQRMLTEALEHGVITVPNETSRDWTYLPDIAKLFDMLLQKAAPLHHLYHFVSNEWFTAHQLAQKIQQHLPNVKLELTKEVTTQLRAPLQTERLQEFNFSDWTPFDVGLKQVIRAQQQKLEVTA
jgi:UDP-glucose 4-epimerase